MLPKTPILLAYIYIYNPTQGKSNYSAIELSEVGSNKLSSMDYWVDASEMNDTKEDLTTGSLSSVAMQLIAVGTPRIGWVGFFNYRYNNH